MIQSNSSAGEFELDPHETFEIVLPHRSRPCFVPYLQFFDEGLSIVEQTLSLPFKALRI